jgi:hypothetical protein
MRRTLALKLLTLSAVLLITLVLPVKQAWAGSTVKYCKEPSCEDGNPIRTGLTEVASNDFRKRLALAGIMSGDDNGPGSLRSKLTGRRDAEQAGRANWSVFLSISVLLVGISGVGFSLYSMIRRARPRAARGRPVFAHQGALACALLAVSLVASYALASFVARTSAAAHSPAANRSAQSADLAQAVNPGFANAFQFGGTGVTQVGGRAVDSAGNLYVTGGFTGAITFNTSPQPTTLASTQDYDFFIAKFNPAGKPLWARVANGGTGIEPGLSLDGGLAVAVDAQGAAYVGGGFVSQLAFKDANGATTVMLGDSNADLNFELFVAKYDSSGNLIWAKGGQSGAPDDPEAETDLDAGINGITDIAVDKSGNLFVGGTFAGTNFLGQTVTTVGADDALLARLNPSTGIPVWVSMTGSTQHDNVLGLGVDDNSNVYVVGDMEGNITFPTQPAPTTMQVDDGEEDTFLAKYNSNGQVLWAKQIGGTQLIEGSHVAVNGAGEIYLTGFFQGTSQFDSITVTDDANTLNGFLAKYNTGGVALWVRSFGKSANGGATGESVALDGSSNPYVIGLFAGDATFAAETSSPVTLKSTGREDQFVINYDKDGAFQFVKQLVGSGKESEDLIKSAKVPVDISLAGIVFNSAKGTLQLTGDFQGTLTLDNLTLDSGANRHAYVATLALTPEIDLSSYSYTVNEGDGRVQITVNRAGDKSAAASVNYALSDAAGLQNCNVTNGNASSRCDYQTTTGTLRFAAGEASKTITVLIVDDSYAEGPETFTLTLSGPVGENLGAVNSATITIIDNDTVTGANPIDSAPFFVRQHYLDFLGRDADPAGFAGWQNVLNNCGGTVSPPCDRIEVSSAFFRSDEFQTRGYFIYRFYAAVGRIPRFAEFMADFSRLSGFLTAQQLEDQKVAFIADFMARADFQAKYGSLSDPAAYVNALLNTVGLPNHPTKQTWITALTAGTKTRAQVLRELVESAEMYRKFYNEAFVIMQYFGYLRRDADALYVNWILTLNLTGDYRVMINGFMNSAEYRQRFGP